MEWGRGVVVVDRVEDCKALGRPQRLGVLPDGTLSSGRSQTMVHLPSCLLAPVSWRSPSCS